MSRTFKIVLGCTAWTVFIFLTVAFLSRVTGKTIPVGDPPLHRVVYVREAQNGWLEVEIDGKGYFLRPEILPPRSSK